MMIKGAKRKIKKEANSLDSRANYRLWGWPLTAYSHLLDMCVQKSCMFFIFKNTQ